METFDGWSAKGKRYCPQMIAETLNRELRDSTLAWFAVPPEETNQQLIHEVAAEFLKTLGRLVDQWIDSGKGENGYSPWNRNINWTSPEYPEPLINTLAACRDDGHAQVALMQSGRFAVLVKAPLNKYRNPFDRARQLALGRFVALMDSPTRERLFRCDECGTYFVWTRAPKKDQLIYHGMFCGNCKGKGAANRRDAKRDRRHDQLVMLAARFWPDWTPRKGRKSVWLARQMNKCLGEGEKPITGKWVTQNQVKIESEVERRQHATCKD